MTLLVCQLLGQIKKRQVDRFSELREIPQGSSGACCHNCKHEHRIAKANAKAGKERLFEGSLAAFKANVESFGNPVAYLTKLSTEKKISYTDMRLELSKIETEMAKLAEEKTNLLNIDPSADTTAACEQHNTRVADVVEQCKQVAFEYVKDDISW